MSINSSLPSIRLSSIRPSSIRPSRIWRPLLLAAASLAVAVPLMAPPSAAAQATQPTSTLQVQVEVDKRVTVDRRTGVVTVTGTVTCSRPASAFVTNSMLQEKHGQSSDGGFAYNVDCSPTPATWESTFTSNTARPFSPGRATLNTGAYVYDDQQGTVVSDTESRTVTLKKA